MNCDRAQELFSDRAERRLVGPLAHELEDHLKGCASCRALSGSLEAVVSALGTLDVAASPRDLTERIVARARPALQQRRERRAVSKAVPAPSWHPPSWSFVAAAAAVVLVLAWRPPELLREASREATQAAHQAYSFGVRTYQETTRWVDDLNVLRMTVGVAFEDRIDQLSERLRDLDEARRRGADDEERDESSSSRDVPPTVASNIFRRSLS